MKAKLLNPEFKYHSAQESQKPGYLARRMKMYRAKEEERKTETNVTQLKRNAK